MPTEPSHRGPFRLMSVTAIREAVASDAAGLAGLMTELGYPVTGEVLWARIGGMGSASHRTFVAEVGGVVAGFAGCSALAIYESDLPTCWIMALAVGSSFRRRGVGRALIQAIEAWCGERGITDIRLHSGDGRGDAHLFYETCGFHRAGLRFKKSVEPALRQDRA